MFFFLEELDGGGRVPATVSFKLPSPEDGFDEKPEARVVVHDQCSDARWDNGSRPHANGLMIAQFDTTTVPSAEAPPTKTTTV